MSICRTCLSKSDLRPIFIDKNLVVSRIDELYAVTGIKIEPNDGLPQLICSNCTYLIKEASQLREISSKANDFFKKTNKYGTVQKDIKLSLGKDDTASSNIDLDNIKISKRKIWKKECKVKAKKNKEDGEKENGIRIEDFESSDDGQNMGEFMLQDLDSNNEEVKVCIEDFESSNSFDDEDMMTIAQELKEDSKEHYRCNQAMKEKQFLERERRKVEIRKSDQKLMALAVTPYDPGGPVRCSVCTATVRNVANFKNHARTHYGLQNACEECGKRFMTVSHVRYHQQRVHGRQKRLACSQCEYRAVDPQQLLNHSRAAHSGERPFSCDVCGATFRMRRHVAQHMATHFGVRNIQCECCPAMFRRRSELGAHQARVHRLLYTYLCPLCAHTYKRAASVRKHLVKVHGVPLDQQPHIKCVKTRRRSCEE